jgi:C1A family cysteine protease
MQVYQCALAHDGNPMQDVGSSLSTVAYILENIGIAPETEFPYTAQLGTPVPTKVLNDAAKDKTTKATRLDANDQSITLANIKAAIAPNAVLPPCYPVMFGFDVPNSFFNTGSDGNMPTPSGGIAGGHANVFIGYDDNHVGNYDGSKGALFAKNSWGTGWGANGLWWMPYSFFDNVSYESGDAWAIITESDFVTPPPASVQFASTPSILQ